VIARATAHVRAVGLAWAHGVGQVLFCDDARGGVLLLLGLGVAFPRAALMSGTACLLATLVARTLTYPSSEWRRGLYGYTGALVGLCWGAVFNAGVMEWLMLGVASIVSAPATRLAHRLLTPRELPALALPALCLVWLATGVLPRGVPGEPAPLAMQFVAWALVLAGLAIYSRLLASTALLGALVGLVVSVALAPAMAPGIVGNALPAAAAIGGLFLPLTTPVLVIAVLGSAVAGTLFWALAPVLGAQGLPLLVAPFNLVTLAILAGLRLHAVRRRIPGRPAPLPLAAVGRPEVARRAELARRRLDELVRGAKSLCVLTGAGVSTAAGIPDFRGPSGLWGRTPLITLDDFVRSADARALYWKEEERFFRLVQSAGPAAVHRALAALEERGRLSAVITQNVDGLHQAAGLPADKVIELHGDIRHVACLDCGRTVARELDMAARSGACYCPACRGLLKGGSVMFGEAVRPERLDAALRALLASDLLLVLGTSLAVAPASDIVGWARDAGIPVAIVNATPTPYDTHAAVTVTADVGLVMLDVLDAADNQATPFAAPAPR
jgi:NAD-dependent protein deacetylase/lipoamidase